MNRRFFVTSLLAGGALTALSVNKVGAFGMFSKKGSGKAESFPFELTDEEWKQRLTPEEYRVLRKEGTERANTSALNDEKRKGTFVCAGCGHALYSSDAKYDSGSGWPSFWQPINQKAVATSIDNKLFYARTEVHCANCGGHLGHVFPDGPKPTGMRHCINGVALDFKAAE